LTLTYLIDFAFRNRLFDIWFVYLSFLAREANCSNSSSVYEFWNTNLWDSFNLYILIKTYRLWTQWPRLPEWQVHVIYFPILTRYCFWSGSSNKN
jgi:hypothetical protein